MTEPQLLKMLADVRAVLHAQSAPITLTGINDALAKTDSRGLTRIALRVIDVLVNTGEVSRDYPAPGMRCSYRSLSGPKAATWSALYKSFEFDLDGNEPASNLPASATEPEIEPEAPAAVAPASPAAEVAQAGDVPTSRPVGERILEILREGPATRGTLLMRLIGCKANHVDNTLWKLKNTGQANAPAKQGGEWSIGSGSPPAPVAKAVEKVADKPAAPPKATTGAAADPIDRALQDLRNRIERKPVSISDLDLKLRTLNRLGELLDPDIRTVLSAISSDLRQVAA